MYVRLSVRSFYRLLDFRRPFACANLLNDPALEEEKRLPRKFLYHPVAKLDNSITSLSCKDSSYLRNPTGIALPGT